MIKNNKAFYILYFIFYILIFNFPHPTRALTFESSQYRIETDPSEKGPQTTTSIIHHSFAQKGYILSSRTDKNLFTITLSQNVLDLLSTQKASITISPPNSRLYTLKTFMPKPFANFDGSSVIANTRCDMKNNPCTPHKAYPWRSSSTYGFGYSVKGVYSDKDFENGFHFRPFSPTPINIAQSDFSSKKNTYQLILKALPPPHQPTGTYQALIHIIAYPDF